MSKNLHEEATRLLRSRGYTWSGRPKGSINKDQARFERVIVLTPPGGAVNQHARGPRRKGGNL